jgi:hypothetical protein
MRVQEINCTFVIILLLIQIFAHQDLLGNNTEN